MSTSFSVGSLANNTSPESRIICEYCSQPKYFKNKSGLNIHIGKIHKNISSVKTVHPIHTQINPLNNLQNNSHNFWQHLISLKGSVPIVKRIPRGSRLIVANTLKQTIDLIIHQNSVQNWEQLLTFAYRILNVDKGEDCSLTQKIKNNCTNCNRCPFTYKQKENKNQKKSSVSFIENKINDGDFKGAARLLFSGDVLAPNTAETLEALRRKHPQPTYSYNPNLTANLTPTLCPLQIKPDDIRAVILSFKNGSAGGVDGLSPQHFKDLTSVSNGDSGEALLKSMSNLVNLMLTGVVPEDILPIIYGANLCALTKKDGSVRPIAVGSTLRRIVSKVCCKNIAPNITQLFQPLQLGFGCKGGCEAAVHAVRTFLLNSDGGILLKVDVKNAFNSIDRNVLLSEVRNKIPQIYPYIWQCYSRPSKLLYQSHSLNSAVGCQQGDPLGPAIFSLAIHSIISDLKSKLNVWYLDDGTLGGEASSVLSDLAVVISKFKSIGLELNFEKCEIYIPSSMNAEEKRLIFENFNILAPGIKLLNEDSLRLLGAPIFVHSIPPFILDQTSKFNECSERLYKINAHMALFIIKYCLFVPKFNYYLRCSPFWKFLPMLNDLDDIIRDTLSKILNCRLDVRAWAQASLPVRYGGLGIRKISCVSLPAFLSSAHSTYRLYGNIINPSLGSIDLSYLAEARNAFNVACPNKEPVSPSSQKHWDDALCADILQELITSSTSAKDRARLLAVSSRESSYWLQALPSKNIGTLLDNLTLTVVVGLRLGARIQQPHQCYCGEAVDEFGHHGLSCAKSAGRFSRHASLNAVIRRSLASAKVPAVLEPNGLARSDGKRPDGMTLVPWRQGRSLVWDATCVDTLAASHLQATSAAAGAGATKAERAKRRKYENIENSFIFVPFGVETLGPWGEDAKSFFKDLSFRLVESTGDRRAGGYLGQHISLAIQRGNAASVLGTLPRCSGMDDFFDP